LQNRTEVASSSIEFHPCTAIFGVLQGHLISDWLNAFNHGLASEKMKKSGSTSMLVGKETVVKVIFLILTLIAMMSYLPASTENDGETMKLRTTPVIADTSKKYDLCVIARYSHTQERRWLGFIGSLFSASSDKNRIHLVFVETDATILETELGHKRLQTLLDQNVGVTKDPFFNVSISKLTNFDHRTRKYRSSLNIPEGKQDFGYVLTDLVVEDMVNSKACDYMLITNGDNLYHSSLMEATSTERKKGTSLIGMHMVSHHEWTADSPNIAKGIIDGPGKDILMKPNLKPNEIDLGAVLWHTDSTLSNPEVRFAKHRDVKNFPRSVPQSFWTADGNTIAFAASIQGSSSIIIPRILFVHL
jgi:hypothetical protein